MLTDFRPIIFSCSFSTSLSVGVSYFVSVVVSRKSAEEPRHRLQDHAQALDLPRRGDHHLPDVAHVRPERHRLQQRVLQRINALNTKIERLEAKLAKVARSNDPSLASKLDFKTKEVVKLTAALDAQERDARMRMKEMAAYPWVLVGDLKKQLEILSRKLGVDAKEARYRRKAAKKATGMLSATAELNTHYEIQLKSMTHALTLEERAALKSNTRVAELKTTAQNATSLLVGVRSELKTTAQKLKQATTERDQGAAEAEAAAAEAAEAAAEAAAAEQAHLEVEAELRERNASHIEAHRELCLALRNKAPPAPTRPLSAWDTMGDEMQRQARHRDVGHLVSVLSTKEFRCADIATALDRLELLPDMWKTLELCDLRQGWLYELRDGMREESFGVRLALHCKCDLLLSKRRMDRLRDLLCKDWDPELERAALRVWWRHPFTDAAVPYPEPLLSRYHWEPAWAEIKRRFNLTTDEDGTVVCAPTFTTPSTTFYAVTYHACRLSASSPRSGRCG